jgi:hypothetical protein
MRSWTRVTVVLLLFVEIVQSCPVCRTGTGAEVRGRIFDADFGYHLLVTILPFVLFYAVAAMIYFDVPRSVVGFCRVAILNGAANKETGS